MRLLHIAAEAYPLAKTGGLADVAAALPAALCALGFESRVLMPAYRGSAEQLLDLRTLLTLSVREQPMRLLEGRLPLSPPGLRFWLLDHPGLYGRAGDPYHDADGEPHPDNAWRYGCFSEAAARLALSGADGWRPDLVHAHDWQAGLVPAWLAEQRRRPATVFSIHNLAYQGRFERREFSALGLPANWWRPTLAEHGGQLSFMQAALATADALTTVSPNYAREIQTPEFGCQLDAQLRGYAGKLSGILNGIDTEQWNPASDAHLVQRYNAASRRQGKAANKRALQQELGLAQDADALLVGVVSRFAEQKGIDALLDALPDLLKRPVQFAVLGAGEKLLQARFTLAAQAAPQRIGLRLGYDEGLAHRIEAGADAFLMPSRFEPCGLNQMYAQRYGTVPLVRAVGGLADTVSDASPAALAAGEATGILFQHSDAGGVRYAVERALELLQTPHWPALQASGMARDFSWAAAAAQYAALYARLLGARGKR